MKTDENRPITGLGESGRPLTKHRIKPIQPQLMSQCKRYACEYLTKSVLSQKHVLDWVSVIQTGFQTRTLYKAWSLSRVEKRLK